MMNKREKEGGTGSKKKGRRKIGQIKINERDWER